jgi:hypothetical protein
MTRYPQCKTEVTLNKKYRVAAVYVKNASATCRFSVINR